MLYWPVYVRACTALELNEQLFVACALAMMVAIKCSTAFRTGIHDQTVQIGTVLAVTKLPLDVVRG